MVLKRLRLADKEWVLAYDPGFFPDDQSVAICRACDGLYLAAEPDSKGEYVLYATSESPIQNAAAVEWKLVSNLSNQYYTVRHVASGKVLDVLNRSKANGAPLGLWTPNGGENQQWEVGNGSLGYFLRARHSKKALDLVDGKFFGQWDFWAGPNQIWHIEPLLKTGGS